MSGANRHASKGTDVLLRCEEAVMASDAREVSAGSGGRDGNARLGLKWEEGTLIESVNERGGNDEEEGEAEGEGEEGEEKVWDGVGT